MTAPTAARSIRLHESTIGDAEIAAVLDVLRSGNVTAGEKVRALEAAIEAMYPGRHAVVCNSGSSANLLAVAERCSPLREDRLKPGDGVIVSALSWPTTVWPLVQMGLVPVFVDIGPSTLNIDRVHVRQAAYQAKAVMPVHVYGNPCDMEALARVCADTGMALIEDCCEALGAEIDGTPVGSFGDAATFSFYFSHHITTGEGGAVITPDPEAADRMRMLRAHGWIRDCKHYAKDHGLDPRFTFVSDGYNLRMVEWAAAIGLEQLPKLPRYVAQRRRAAQEMQRLVFAKYQWLSTQRDHGRSSWFGFALTVAEDAPVTAKQLRAHLEAHGIETRSIISGNMARQPGMQLFPHRVHGDLKHADAVMDRGFSIACHQGVDSEDVDYLADVMAAL